MLKAAVCRAFGQDLVIEDVELAVPRAGEVRVKLAACAICHSDLAYMDGAWGGALPAVYGHEASGIVETVGPAVTGVSPGDPVVVTLIRSCGTCRCCSRGNYSICEGEFALDRRSPLSGPDGSSIAQGLRTAAFAEAVLVDASQIVAIPRDVKLDSAALLACGVITGFGAVANTAQIEPGTDVVVIGAGGVGLNAIQGAVHCGAAKVIAIDITDAKLDDAAEFGATDLVNSAKQNAVEAVRGLTGGRGADYVFIAVGAKPAFDSSYAMLARGGAAVLVGMPADGIMSEYELVALASGGKRILGSKMGSADIRADIPKLIGLYRKGTLKLDELISGHYRLEEINAAVAAVRGGEVRRNVIVF